MAALVKGLSGSATFRSPAGSWAMLSRISGGGRRCRVLGRRLSLKHGRCAVRDRTLEDWFDALGVTAAKAKAGIPCPLCGGTDRFHVQRGTRGQAVIGGCRICSKPLYPDIAYAVFGDSDRDSRRPAARPTHSVSRPSDLAAAQRAYARRCWESADWTPNSPSHPTRRWLWSRQGRDAAGPSFWWTELPPPPVVRYLTAFPAPGYPLDGGNCADAADRDLAFGRRTYRADLLEPFDFNAIRQLHHHRPAVIQIFEPAFVPNANSKRASPNAPQGLCRLRQPHRVAPGLPPVAGLCRHPSAVAGATARGSWRYSS